MEEVKLSYVIIGYEEPVIYRRYTRPTVLSGEQVIECAEITNRLTGNKPYVVLADTRTQIDLTPEAHKVSVKLQQEIKATAQAVLVNWVGQRLVVNAFMEISKPPYPMKAFTDEKEAIKWLMKQWKKRTN